MTKIKKKIIKKNKKHSFKFNGCIHCVYHRHSMLLRWLWKKMFVARLIIQTYCQVIIIRNLWEVSLIRNWFQKWSGAQIFGTTQESFWERLSIRQDSERAHFVLKIFKTSGINTQTFKFGHERTCKLGLIFALKMRSCSIKADKQI